MRKNRKYIYFGLLASMVFYIGANVKVSATEKVDSSEYFSTEQSSENFQQTEPSSTIDTDSSSSSLQTETSEQPTSEPQRAAEEKVAQDLSINYKTHVQTYGWQPFVSNGNTSGTEGQAKRLEGIEIGLSDRVLNGQLQYRTHVQTYGWQDYVSGGNISGTQGQAKRLEAIQIRLTGALAQNYDIYYRVHSAKFGWLDWAKNGTEAGTEGYALRLEAIQIKLVKKNTAFEGSTNRPFIKYSEPSLTYTSHVQTYGWIGNARNNEIMGTVGEAKRMEAIKINANASNVTGGISYSSHLQSIGWQSYVSNGAISGTQGQGKRMEAIKIHLTGELAQTYDIYYRAHIQSFGWLGWAANNSPAGSSGGRKRIEAIQIRLVKKGLPAPQLGKAFLEENHILTAAEREQREIQRRLNTRPYYYSQLDSRWNNRYYGMAKFGSTGCVPTSMAMVLRGNYGMNVTPMDTAERVFSYGGFNQQYFGSSGPDLINGMNAYGRRAVVINSLAELNNYLAKGYPVIMYVNVGIGHAIVGHGYSNGKTTIYDPYGQKFYSGQVSTSHLWSVPAQDFVDWPAGRPFFVIL